jgi:hypothetical protein
MHFTKKKLIMLGKNLVLLTYYKALYNLLKHLTQISIYYLLLVIWTY